jgi:hypothetical protein
VWLAVVSQPFDCHAVTPALREVDRKSGEFWVPNPWDFATQRENLSAYERNGVYLNLGNGRFANIGHASGADSDGDGRSAVGCDVTGDGRPELFVRQAGGGPLRVYRNRFPDSGWLTVSLEGQQSNRQGIGARVIAHLGKRTVRRELYPVINFLSQAPARVTLGLGDAPTIDRLEIHWPSGKRTELEDVAINRHLVISE